MGQVILIVIRFMWSAKYINLGAENYEIKAHFKWAPLTITTRPSDNEQ